MNERSGEMKTYEKKTESERASEGDLSGLNPVMLDFLSGAYYVYTSGTAVEQNDPHYSHHSYRY